MTLYMGSIDKALWIHKTEEKALSYEKFFRKEWFSQILCLPLQCH